MSKHDIFLSYSRKDEVIAKRLSIGLQARGVRLFLDQKDIQPGAIFETNIFSDLRASKSYGIVLTEHSLRSQWVIREYEYARDSRSPPALAWGSDWKQPRLPKRQEPGDGRGRTVSLT